MTYTKQPNIILVNCDDLGYGDLGCYNSPCNKTPHLDKMAQEGLKFTDFYMGSPVCSPSRGAMMTGCYPPRIGFGDFEGKAVLFPGQGVGLNPSEVTIPKILKAAGYDTKIIGKWHCGDQKEFLPTRHGFDEYYGLPYSNDMGRQKGRESGAPLPLLRGEEVIQEQPDQTGLTERYVTEAIDFIRRKKEKPFFLYFAHMYVHVPLFVPKQFLDKSTNGPYGGAVECIDWTMGVLFAELKKLGIDENSLVIFTSDNGSRAKGEGGSNAPLRGTKASTWEGGIRVPCLMRWPAKIKGNTICRDIVSAIDFLPTFKTLSQSILSPTLKTDGLDISKTITEGAPSPRDIFFYYMQNSLRAVRKNKWKLHLQTGMWGDIQNVEELYNLEEDPSETKNLVKEFPEVVRGLKTICEECRNDLGDSNHNVLGKNVREKGRVENPKTLTTYDEDHPYIVALYDLEDGRTMSG